MPVIYLNGQFHEHIDAALDPLDRGVLLGDGLFETLRCEKGQLLFHEEHFARLAKGARQIEIPFNLQSEDLLQICQQVIDANRYRGARLRVTVTRGELHGSLDIAESPTAPTVLVHARTIDLDAIDDKRRDGWKAMMMHFPINHLSPLAQVKSTSYQERVLARHWAKRQNFDEAVFLNTDGLLAEGAMSNLFIVDAGHVKTPPVEDGALPGIIRRRIIELCGRLEIPFEEESLTVEDLREADEAFFTSSLIEVMPLVKLDKSYIGEGEPGLITRRLFDAHRRDVASYVSAIRGG